MEVLWLSYFKCSGVEIGAEVEVTIGQTENTDLVAGTDGGQRVGIGNLTSTEAKAETENKTGNLRRKVSSCGQCIGITL